MLDPNLSPRGSRRATLATLFLAVSLSTSMLASGADAPPGPSTTASAGTSPAKPAAAADGKSITPVPAAKIEAVGTGGKTVAKHRAWGKKPITPPRPRPLTDDAKAAESAAMRQPIDPATAKPALAPVDVPPKGK
jgi:hypothetical protein